MPSLCRPSARATIGVTPCMVASYSFGCAAPTLSIMALSSECEELAIPKICDIFDAPVRLRGSREWSRRSKTISYASSAGVVAQSNTPNGTYSEAMESPWSLPPPIIFDGPARPPHMSQLVLEQRRSSRQNTAQLTRKGFKSSTASFKTLTSPSEPIHEVFDSPSRIARYKYLSSPPGATFRPYVLTSLFIASAYGWLAYQNQLDRYQRNKFGTA